MLERIRDAPRKNLPQFPELFHREEMESISRYDVRQVYNTCRYARTRLIITSAVELCRRASKFTENKIGEILIPSLYANDTIHVEIIDFQKYSIHIT